MSVPKRNRFGLTTRDWIVAFCIWSAASFFTYPLASEVFNSFFPVRHGHHPRNACINNLRQIDGAKEQWALETKHSTNDLCLPREVDAYIKGGAPICPEGGKYIYGKIGEDPRCTIPTHTIAWPTPPNPPKP